MSKDPAILFYTSDFLSGTAFFTDEQRGQYIKLLCEQHQNGHIPEGHMIDICKTYDSPVLRKFIKDNQGYFFNERMEKEIIKRVNYSESRRKNRFSSKQEKDMSVDMSNHMSEHMDNGNGNENDIINVDVINYNNIIANFHLFCDRMSKVSKLSDQRKKHVAARFKEFDIDTISEVIIKAGKSDFLCGKNDKAWKADFDWIFNQTNFLKILEGKYDNKVNGKAPAKLMMP